MGLGCFHLPAPAQWLAHSGAPMLTLGWGTDGQICAPSASSHPLEDELWLLRGWTYTAHYRFAWKLGWQISPDCLFLQCVFVPVWSTGKVMGFSKELGIFDNLLGKIPKNCNIWSTLRCPSPWHWSQGIRAWMLEEPHLPLRVTAEMSPDAFPKH